MKIRVMVIDDSAFSRRTITKMLEGLPGIDVVGYAINGEEGIQKIIALKPDLVTLDLEMPKMDGFTLLRILTARFSIPVIVISAQNQADKVFKALELGAFDFIPKPSSAASPDLLMIQGDLHQKVLQVMNNKTRIPFCQAGILPDSVKGDLTSFTATDVNLAVDVVAIGASTGGPPALQRIFASFEQSVPLAIVVSQHMPVGFTHAFAERLNRSSTFSVKEAEDGDPVRPGHVLIAPGGKNLTFDVQGNQVIARVKQPDPTERYIPCIDVMFESCAAIYQSRMIAVVLTGMGNDGSRGIKAVKKHGGYIIAESNETSVVYGMPREAAATGLVDKIVPLQQVAKEIMIKSSLL
ncbi:protein-glutamate methylesterase/protein-glutamine glutaminase [Pelotalea chapellei]|uniref:Protein-glutamate methylesterase/protein-glutamine glutaminase n=1 Tax=Pelotalea chapellei TaxID=44671 RepID=A0ABS5U7L6_9BACT|nr:chemotaxis response regulator protein-glutamate methylesterase [Pelotalea chapellei]MBT1071644.1 chemotaxis response regulator protein-glutamate methylesterase [Pelotalea chapellei]